MFTLKYDKNRKYQKKNFTNCVNKLLIVEIRYWSHFIILNVVIYQESIQLYKQAFQMLLIKLKVKKYILQWCMQWSI